MMATTAGCGSAMGRAPSTLAVAYGKNPRVHGRRLSRPVWAEVFDFGFAKAMAQYFRDSKDVSRPKRLARMDDRRPDQPGFRLLSDFILHRERQRRPRPYCETVAAGYVYNMSKRTAVFYGTLSYIENDDGADFVWRRRSRRGEQALACMWTWASAIRSDSSENLSAALERTS